MFYIVSNWSPSVRYTIFVCCNLFIVLWTRYVITRARPGAPRLCLSIPVILTCSLMSFLFDFALTKEHGTAMFICTNYLWLAVSKTIGLSLNRGQLIKSVDCGSMTAFVVGMLLPVNLKFKETRITETSTSKGKTGCFDDVEFSIVSCQGIQLIHEVRDLGLRLLYKAVTIWILMRMVGWFKDWAIWKSVVYSWLAYCWIGGSQDLSSMFILLTLRMKLSPNFDQPLKATTVGEFWAKRWNLIMHLQLKEVFYDPYIQGRYVASRKYFQKTLVSFPKRLFGIFYTFVVSGFIHAILAMHVTHTMNIPHRYLHFFTLNGLIVVCEKIIKHSLISIGWYDSISAKIPSFVYCLYVQVVLLLTAHYLFWPDLVSSGIVDKMVEGMSLYSHSTT